MFAQQICRLIRPVQPMNARLPQHVISAGRGKRPPDRRTAADLGPFEMLTGDAIAHARMGRTPSLMER